MTNPNSILRKGNYIISFPAGTVVKNPPAKAEMSETGVPSLGWEDPLEKGMAIHSVFLPGEICGQRSMVGYSAWSCKESDTTEQLTLSLS